MQLPAGLSRPLTLSAAHVRFLFPLAAMAASFFLMLQNRNKFGLGPSRQFDPLIMLLVF